MSHFIGGALFICGWAAVIALLWWTVLTYELRGIGLAMTIWMSIVFPTVLAVALWDFAHSKRGVS